MNENQPYSPGDGITLEIAVVQDLARSAMSFPLPGGPYALENTEEVMAAIAAGLALYAKVAGSEFRGVGHIRLELQLHDGYRPHWDELVHAALDMPDVREGRPRRPSGSPRWP